MNITARRRKIAAATKRLNEALALLDEVARDFVDTPGPVGVDGAAMWRSVVDAAAATERARNALA